MCFQGFVYFRCGHSKIVEESCELANDLPFYIKCACPKYTAQTAKPTYDCGNGNFYCKHSPDGPMLEHVHEVVEHARWELNRVHQAVQQWMGMAQRFNNQANQGGVSREERKKHPDYARIVLRRNVLLQKQAAAQARLSQGEKLIQAAKEHYMKGTHHVLSGAAGAYPPFTISPQAQAMLPSGLLPPPIEYGMEPVTSGRPLIMTQPTFPGHNNPSLSIPHAQLRPQSSSSEENNIFVARTKDTKFGIQTPTYRLQSLPQVTASVAHGRGKKKGGTKRVQQVQVSETMKGKEPSVSPAKKPPPLKQETSGVRRSTRARKKRISYAESTGSSGLSREPSPGKSEASGFSPSKSDMNSTPGDSDAALREESREMKKEADELDDNKPKRSSSPLRDMIGDWQRRQDVKRRDNRHTGQASAKGQANVQSARPSMLLDQDTLAPPSSANPYATIPGISPSMAGMRNLFQTGAALPQRVPNPLPPMHPSTISGISNMSPFAVSSLNTSSRLQPAGMAQPYFPESNQGTSSNLYNMYANQSMNAGVTNIPYHQQLSNMSNAQTVEQKWLINTPAFEQQAGPAVNPLQLSEDSAGQVYTPMTATAPNQPTMNNSRFPNTSHRPILNSSYEKMRRSFSATTTLSPVPTTSRQLPNTDPTKRSAPASSPLLPPSKYIRLSFPGDTPSTNIHNNSTIPCTPQPSMSSPPKFPSRQITHPTGSQGECSTPAHMSEDPPSTPAPIIVPTAIVIPAVSENNRSGCDFKAGGSTDVSSNPQGGETGADNEFDNQFSEIDWILDDGDGFEDFGACAM